MKKFIALSIGSVVMCLLSAITHAGSAQWDLNPASGDWNTAANWTPMTVPNASTDRATFGVSNTTNVSISAITFVDRIVFNPGAGSFTITSSPNFFPILTLSGEGVTNNSGRIQNFATPAASQDEAKIVFTNSATAGSLANFTNSGGGNNFLNQLNGVTIFLGASNAGSASFTNNGGSGGDGGATGFGQSSSAANGVFVNKGGTASGFLGGGLTNFSENSTAGNGVFTNNGGTVIGAGGGRTFFANASTAGNGTFTNNGSMVGGSFSGSTQFIDASTAANGTFINNGGTVTAARGGSTIFSGASTAGSATLVANPGMDGGQGGTILFEEHSDGGASRVELFGNGNLDVSSHGVTIGSIEGDGNVFLGANNLTVGSNNLNTTFSGVIQDGGTGGSLTKIGTGTLTLTGTNTYSGGTRIGIFSTNSRGGVLQVDGSIKSNAFVGGLSAFAGVGKIFGNLTNGNGGTVSPGDGVGTLTVSNNYTQTQWGSLLIQIAGPNTGQLSVLNVLGNASLTGYLDPVLLNGFIPTIGESFTFLNSASLTGAFSHIQDQVFDNGMEQWNVVYQPTDAILTVGPNTIPDRGSTSLLLALSLLGLVMYRRQLLHKRA
jgi:hypothetical protein